MSTPTAREYIKQGVYGVYQTKIYFSHSVGKLPEGLGTFLDTFLLTPMFTKERVHLFNELPIPLNMRKALPLSYKSTLITFTFISIMAKAYEHKFLELPADWKDGHVYNVINFCVDHYDDALIAVGVVYGIAAISFGQTAKGVGILATESCNIAIRYNFVSKEQAAKLNGVLAVCTIAHVYFIFMG